MNKNDYITKKNNKDQLQIISFYDKVVDLLLNIDLFCLKIASKGASFFDMDARRQSNNSLIFNQA